MSTSSGDGVRVSVLGPVRAWLGGEERPLGPARQRAVLGLLTARANRLVSRDELVDGLWGDAPPASAVGSLHTYVSGLRRALGPARDVLVSQTSGYSLRLAVGAVDAEVFARARSDARLRLDAGDHRAARAALEDALGLWHGEAYSGVPGPFAEVERRRLEELRLSAVELKARAALELGAHREVVAELGGLVGEHPQRESLWEVLMVALDRSGRQAEALEAFREARRALVDGQGVEPGRVLRDLHQRIVTGTPEHRRLLTVPPHVAEAARTPGTARDAGAGGMAGLAGEVGAVDVAGAARETGAASVGVPDGEAERVCEAGAAGGGGGADGFVGRRDEIALLRGLVADVAAGRGAAVWVEGEAGIGKSALLTAALADAARRGCQVGWAVADESGRRFPLQAVHDCLDLRPDGRPCHVPDHRNPTRHAPARHDPARHDPAHQDRTRQDPLPAAVDRLLGLVDRICADGPLLLVLDDLHRADDAGLLMWYRLLDATRRLPLLLVAASRPDPARRELTGLRRGVEARHGHVLALGPLAARDTEELVGRVVGGRPGEVLREVARRTAGHPLYAHEVAHALVRDGAVRVVDGVAVVDRAAVDRAPSLPGVVDRALDSVSPATREVLRSAALLGVAFRVDALCAVTGRSAPDLVGVLEEAVRASVLVEAGDELAFRHPYLREALYRGFARPLRVALRRHVAEVAAPARKNPYRPGSGTWRREGEEVRDDPARVFGAVPGRAASAGRDPTRAGQLTRPCR